MKKAFVFTLFITLFIASLFAQTEGKVFIVETLVCDSTGAALKDVAVYDAKDNLRSVTNRDGMAHFATHMGETLYFSHLSYKKKAVRIDKKTLIESEDGRYSMLVVMQRKTNTLTEVTVTENAPHLAYANKKVWVIDYKVQHDGIYMVAGNGDESVLLHLGFEQDTISRKPIASKYQELYRDAFDNLHLIGPDSTYQIYCDGMKLHLLYGCKKETFRQVLSPVVAATDSVIVLEEWRNYGQEVVFIAVNRNNGQRFLLQDVGGETVEMARNLALDDKRDVKIEKLGEKDTAFIDIRKKANSEFKNMKEDLKKRLMFRSVYCPLFGIGNKFYLFAYTDHETVIFDNMGNELERYPLTFHEYRKWNGQMVPDRRWKQKMMYDAARKEFYTFFVNDGIYTLKRIDLKTGTAISVMDLSGYPFAKNMRIHDGVLYFIYPTGINHRKALYQVKID